MCINNNRTLFVYSCVMKLWHATWVVLTVTFGVSPVATRPRKYDDLLIGTVYFCHFVYITAATFNGCRVDALFTMKDIT